MFLKKTCEKCVLINNGDYVNSRYSIKYNALGVVTCVFDKITNSIVTDATVLSDAQIIITEALNGNIEASPTAIALTNFPSDVSIVNCSIVPSYGFDEDTRCFSTTVGGTPEVQLEINYKYDMSLMPRQVVGIESAIVLESTNPALVAGDRYGVADIVFTPANFDEGSVTIDDEDRTTSYISINNVELFEVKCAICQECI